MHPSLLSIHDFSYALPESRIAAFPLSDRDASKLLIYKRGSITEDSFSHLADRLPADCRLLLNNTRVVEARLLFQKPSGGVIEIFCLEPAGEVGDLGTAMNAHYNANWKCLIGGASKWKKGMVLEKQIQTPASEYTLRAAISDREADYFVVAIEWTAKEKVFAEVLHDAGAIPLPPYIKRTPNESDRERYQTVYAQYEGSVAAPTAGLHFTPAVFAALAHKNIPIDFLTLHVGAGTFKPVKSATMANHDMHTEFIEADMALLESLTTGTPNIFCVGTTSMRTAESLYWMGVKLIANPDLSASELPISQWEVYEEKIPQQVPVQEALFSLINWMKKKGMKRLISRTAILIAPGYKPRVARGLITNFHQPQSTLLLLVAACIGDDWKKVYDYALSHDFRFLSYGDACLLNFGE